MLLHYTKLYIIKKIKKKTLYSNFFILFLLYFCCYYHTLRCVKEI